MIPEASADGNSIHRSRQAAADAIGAQDDRQVDIAVGAAELARDQTEGGQLQYSPASTKVGRRFS
jgi:hypothetical protein